MRQQVQKIVAWHPVLTDHQAFTYQELACQSGLAVVVQVAKLEDEARRAQGWTDTRAKDIERQLIPRHGFLKYGIKYMLSNRRQVHIFGSAFENWRMMIILWLASLMRVEFYIVSEPYSHVYFGYLGDVSSLVGRLKAFLRPTLYKFYCRVICRGSAGVFAISRRAIQQFRKSGIPSEKIFPFGYFVPSERIDQNVASAIRAEQQCSLRVVFLGSLIKIKDIPTLLAGVCRAAELGASVRLDVYGPGDASQLDLGVHNVRYLGKIAFGKAQDYLGGYDLLVLPSHYDGWGVVVNEALCAGVPVLCSDQVGARVLLETFGVGQVFARGDAHALADLFVTLANRPERLQAMKSACAAAAEAIQPARAAAYMLEVLSAEPSARAGIPSPWYRGLPDR
jgi:glycosyltransferase involved in cell wall biosynthesis